jgi:hypothetical protein
VHLAVLAVVLLAGEPVRFDQSFSASFTRAQVAQTSAATRAGLVKWAATAEGRRLLERFTSSEYEVVVTEDLTASGIGSAPQPGAATMLASASPSTRKRYELILNPSRFRLPEGMTPLPNQPTTTAELMATAWAAEMLHIEFYSRGITLPHHERGDFQDAWRDVAAQLGFPAMRHGEPEDTGSRIYERREPIVIGAERQ